MKYNIIWILILWATSIVQGQNDVSNELAAINDVLPEILQQERTSNPYIDCYIPETSTNSDNSESDFHFGYNKNELDSLAFLVYINDTLIALPEVIRRNKWIYKNDAFKSVYLDLVRQKSFKSLNQQIVDSELIVNTWRYDGTTDDWQTWEDGVYLVKLKLSRVSFNNDRTLGFFYIEILDCWDNGYSSLILIAKKRFNNRWNLIDGTYYR